jgi:tetratricopeptide (TPR) repeat protein
VILSRVDRLEPVARQVLESASVMGRLFRRRLLERIIGEEPAVERAVWGLQDRAFVYQERVVPEEEYSFNHVLTQETVYQSLLGWRRAALHQQVGEAIEATYTEGLDEHYEALAYHYERSGADEKTVEYLLKAGEKTRRAYLNEEAMGDFQRALRRLEGPGLGEARKEWRLAALTGLGQIHHGMGKEAEAEEIFRQAIAVGREMGLPPHEMVRLYGWLGDVLWWQNRYDEMIRIGEEGLALLGDQTGSVGSALMNTNIALGHFHKGNRRTFREFTGRNASFLPRLPYSEELRAPFLHVFTAYRFDKDVEKATRWLQAFERVAAQHHDLRALGEVHNRTSIALLAETGDARRAIPENERALELFTRIGDEKHAGYCLQQIGQCCLSLGNSQGAEGYLARGLEISERMGDKLLAGIAREQLGVASLCRGTVEAAIQALERARQLYREITHPAEARVTIALGRVALARGERQAAARQFREAAALARRDPLSLASALSALEEAADDPAAFRACCHGFRAEYPEAGDLPFTQWFLEPTEAHIFGQLLAGDVFVDFLSSDWAWEDPLGDCSFTVGRGLAIRAANGRDLWDINWSAPRLLRPVTGEFAVQTVCHPFSGEQPGIGGLLLWKDQRNFLRLERGAEGKHDVCFRGCLENDDLIFGRGRLPAERVFLRLERLGRRVSALCSTDGREWFTAGHAAFPAADPVEVGLHAIGTIDRTIYPGAYREGSAIRFEAFRVFGA